MMSRNNNYGDSNINCSISNNGNAIQISIS